MLNDMGMMLNRRRAYSGKKLPYDAEIEYLESTGTQYIETGIVPTDDISVNISCMFLGSSYDRNDSYAIGRWVSQYAVFAINYYNGYFRFFRWSISGNGQAATRGTLNRKYELGLYKNGYSIDGTFYGKSWPQLPETIPELILFGNSPTYTCRMRLFDCNISIGSTLVRDYTPVRVGQTGYLYDKVSGQLLGNAGTGDFILGPDK